MNKLRQIAKGKENLISTIQFGMTFGFGLLGGAIGGTLVSKRIHEAQHMPHATTMQHMIAKERGNVQANCLVSRVESRYWQLFCQRPSLANEVLRQHLNHKILPGLALYQILREEGLEEQDALVKIANVFAEIARNRQIQIYLLSRTSFYYKLLRTLVPRVIERSYPTEGWDIQWIEDNQESIAFNIHSCFYLDTLTSYGAPELTLVYCAMDDLVYGTKSPYVKWKRKGTMARGDALCDFCWRRVSSS